MTRFILIRHATNDTVGKRLTGRTPGVVLNEAGKMQTQQLVQRLAGLPIKAVYTSPLERAIETALPVARLFHVEPIISQDLIEVDFGNWTNATFDDLRSVPRFKLFNSFRSCTRVPGGELMMEAQLRMIAGLEKLCIAHPHETVAVVGHADLIKAAIAFYAGIHLDMFQRIEISPASVSILDLFEETTRILTINNTGDLSFNN